MPNSRRRGLIPRAALFDAPALAPIIPSREGESGCQRFAENRKKGRERKPIMTKAELVSAMADKAGITKSQAKDALDAFMDSVTGSLKSGQEVRLVGFGSFVPVSRAAGVARNPRTGESVNRPASQTARFRIGEGLKAALNS